MLTIGVVLGLLAYCAYTAARCFFRVEQGHLAVLTTFGAAVHRADDPARLRTYGPGLHTRLPWQKVHQVSIKEQSLDLSGEQGGLTAMAGDGTVLRFDSILRYAPVEAQLGHLLFGLRSPIEHITGAFTCLLRNEIANFRAPDPDPQPAAVATIDATAEGSYAVIRRERRTLNERIETFCRAQIGDRYGVRFHAVDLTDILPPDELAQALNAVIHAQSEADALYARAEADCEQRILSAERGVAIARARAAAVETEITTLGSFLEQLARDQVLGHYVARRRAEVLAESRCLYLKGAT